MVSSDGTAVIGNIDGPGF